MLPMNFISIISLKFYFIVIIIILIIVIYLDSDNSGTHDTCVSATVGATRYNLLIIINRYFNNINQWFQD